MATILYLSKKLQYFDNKNWRDGDIDFIKQYQNTFQNEFIIYQKQVQRKAHQPDISEKIDNIENKKLIIFCNSQQTILSTNEFDNRQNKITQYLLKDKSLTYSICLLYLIKN